MINMSPRRCVGDWTGPIRIRLVAQMARPVRHSGMGVATTGSLVKLQNERERECVCVYVIMTYNF
jgi:hypothetical protein